MLRKLSVALVGLWSLASVAQSRDFQPLAVPLAKFRAGGGGEIAIRFDASSFRVMQLKDSEITAEQGRALLAGGKSYPRLKMTRTGVWVSHEVNRSVAVDQPMGKTGVDDAPRKWKKSAWTAIGTYERAQWPKFVEFALANGLSGVQEVRYQGGTATTLTFAPSSPAVFDAGGHKLELNDAFRQQMRFSPEYPARKGSRGFVILLHDPHQSVSGRYQTLAGLRTLISTNAGTKFRFLVEGAYEDPSRAIPFNGLDRIVNAAGETRAAVVYSLLGRYAINTPLAYRLLYDQKMSAYAIDNNELLRYDAPARERSPAAKLKSIEAIEVAIEKPDVPLSAGDKKQFREILNMAAVYLMADLQDAPDDQVVEYYKSLRQMYSGIAAVGREVAKAGIPISEADLDAITGDAARCKAQENIYQKALDRNKTMAPEIIRQVQASGPDLAIAFIGSYHTSGITTALESAGVGYVVIEPRPKRPATEAESEAFDRANHPNTRHDYLRGVSLNMGFNAPTAVEVRNYLAPKMESRIPGIRSAWAAIQRDFNSIPGSAVDVERLTSVMNNNGSLALVTISSGGNRPPPPGNFTGAFAYFEPGDGAGKESHLVIPDPRDSRWKERDRYGFLMGALFVIPEQRAGTTVTTDVQFHQETGSAWLLYTVYDQRSKRTYCFEGPAEKASLMVAAPLPQKTGDHDIRTTVVEVIRKGARNDG